MNEPTTAIRIRVECSLYASDDDFPIRLLVVDESEHVLTELKFTPTTARESAYSVTRLIGLFVPRSESHKLAEGLRHAAAKVWAVRN